MDDNQCQRGFAAHAPARLSQGPIKGPLSGRSARFGSVTARLRDPIRKKRNACRSERIEQFWSAPKDVESADGRARPTARAVERDRGIRAGGPRVPHPHVQQSRHQTARWLAFPGLYGPLRFALREVRLADLSDLHAGAYRHSGRQRQLALGPPGIPQRRSGGMIAAFRRGGLTRF